MGIRDTSRRVVEVQRTVLTSSVEHQPTKPTRYLQFIPINSDVFAVGAPAHHVDCNRLCNLRLFTPSWVIAGTAAYVCALPASSDTTHPACGVGTSGAAFRRGRCRSVARRACAVVGAVLRCVDDGVVILRHQTRYFAPARALGRLRLTRGQVVSFRPSRSAHGTPIALGLRLHDDAGAATEGRR
jgi:hypothetical protein